jgi:hypothetical protein
MLDDRADRDRRYNFQCPGCRKRRNKRAAQTILGTTYCRACSAVILKSEPERLRWMRPLRDVDNA